MLKIMFDTFSVLSFTDSVSRERKLYYFLGLHRILNWPDIRPICFAGYPVSGRISGWIVKGCHKKTTGWHFLNNFYSFRNFTVIFSGDLGFEETIYHVFFRPDIQPDIRLSGQTDIRQTKPDIRPDTVYKKGRISGATLIFISIDKFLKIQQDSFHIMFFFKF